MKGSKCSNYKCIKQKTQNTRQLTEQTIKTQKAQTMNKKKPRA